MNYKKLYNKIIENRQLNSYTGYTENHDIIQKSLGGSNDDENLVRLTAREHFICHLLLTKIYTKGSNEYYKMCHAFLRMLTGSRTNQRYTTSRKFEQIRISVAEHVSKYMKESQKGIGNSQYGTVLCIPADSEKFNIKLSKRFNKNDIPAGWLSSTEWRKIQKIKYLQSDTCTLKLLQKKKLVALSQTKGNVILKFNDNTEKNFISVHAVERFYNLGHGSVGSYKSGRTKVIHKDLLAIGVNAIIFETK